MDELMTFLSNNIASSEGIIIIDDMGSKKKGKISPAVASQYFSETKKIANCQRMVTCVYTEPIGPKNADMITWPLSMQLMIPKKWDKDKRRREKAGMPPELRYKKNWEYGLNLIENARILKVPHKCIIADTDYGRVRDFREQLQEWEEPYIMSVRLDKLNVVPEDTPILLPGAEGKHAGRRRRKPFLPKGVKTENPGTIIKKAKDWTKVRWGVREKGPLEALFTRRRVRTCDWKTPTDETGWLLLQKGEEGKKAYICWGLDDLSLEELVKMAHSRWAIEEYHKYIKDRLGFDHFEGRKYRGWFHHSVLTQMAFALLSWLRWKLRDPDEKKPLPTLPEVHRMLIFIIVQSFLLDEYNCALCRTCPVIELVCESG
jgi:SRSO17 transposase